VSESLMRERRGRRLELIKEMVLDDSFLLLRVYALHRAEFDLGLPENLDGKRRIGMKWSPLLLPQIFL